MYRVSINSIINKYENKKLSLDDKNAKIIEFTLLTLGLSLESLLDWYKKTQELNVVKLVQNSIYFNVKILTT
jgi:hypothetical protein